MKTEKKIVVAILGFVTVLLVIFSAMYFTSLNQSVIISEEKAIEIAEEEVEGEATNVTIETELGRPVYEATVNPDEGLGLYEVDINAETGEVLEVKRLD